MLRVLVVGWILVAATVHAETIAMLPLDGEKRLELYGQPVAAEIGRAIQEAGIEVVVVGAKMAVPDRAQLIVDGSIKSGKGDAVVLSIRIRDPRDGTVLQTVPATATSLTAIDKAAAELSTKIVPAVQTHLMALRPQPQPDKPAEPAKPPVVTATRPERIAPELPMLFAAISAPKPTPALQLLAHALGVETPKWSAAHKRTTTLVDAQLLGSSRVELSMALEVVGFHVDPGEVPLARARVRVRIPAIKLDRTIRTDTIVGDKGITEDELAARTAREVLAIIHAQLRRKWRNWK